MTTFGNTQLLSSQPTGFLCSRQFSSKAIMSCLDWAVDVANDESKCIMSTFHSTLEKEVLSFLLNGKCKIILVLGRSQYKKLPPELLPALDANRLLIISLTNHPGITKESAQQCNDYILDHAHDLVFGFISQGSHLETIRQTAIDRNIPFTQLAQIETINPNTYERP